MAGESPCHEHMIELEEYIEMDPSSNMLLCYTLDSPLRPGDFEFHLPHSHGEMEPSPSPADELFYKGKLLPLHLPPRVLMVEKLLRNPSPDRPAVPEWEDACGKAAGDQLLSMPKKTWVKKLKLMKQLACIKSLFAKLPRSSGSPSYRRRQKTIPAHVAGSSTSHRSSVSSTSHSFPTMATDNWLYPCSSTSSSSSSSSSSTEHLKHEAESSIQGAIEHCKDSLQKVSARKSLSDVGCCSLTVARVITACEDDHWAYLY